MEKWKKNEQEIVIKSVWKQALKKAIGYAFLFLIFIPVIVFVLWRLENSVIDIEKKFILSIWLYFLLFSVGIFLMMYEYKRQKELWRRKLERQKELILLRKVVKIKSRAEDLNKYCYFCEEQNIPMPIFYAQRNKSSLDEICIILKKQTDDRGYYLFDIIKEEEFYQLYEIEK